MIEIPLTSDPEQLFSVVLNEIKYDMRVMLNSRTAIWSASFSNNGVKIIDNVALLGGIDIFDQYNFGIKNMFVVNLDKLNRDPSRDNLGTIAKLFMLTDEELSNV